MSDQLHSDWRTWIIENTWAGCAPACMISTMMGAGLTRIQAARAIVECNRYVYSDVDWQRLPVIATDDRQIPVLEYIDRPRILVLDQVISAHECAELQESVIPELRDSTVFDSRTGARVMTPDRNSQSVYLAPSFSALTRRLARRFCQIMHIPEDHGEDLQVVRYHTGGEYRRHWDFFPALEPEYQRTATLLVYLNTVVDGGATYFPRADFRVSAQQGRGVYFQYQSTNGRMDILSEHAGEPVGAGEKWIVTQWARANRLR